MPLSEIDEASTDDLEKGYDEETAVQEAERCLKCGLICYKKNSLIHMIGYLSYHAVITRTLKTLLIQHQQGFNIFNVTYFL